MSYQSVQSVLSQLRNPAYVCPVDPFVLGRRAFNLGIDLQESAPAAVKRGWEAAFIKCTNEISAEDYKAASAFVDSVLGAT
jgi:hypothetical protein